MRDILLGIGEPVTLPFPQVTFAPCNWARKEPGELSNGRTEDGRNHSSGIRDNLYHGHRYDTIQDKTT